MVDLNRYRQLIQDLLTELHAYDRSDNRGGVESQVIFDSERDPYLLIYLGWEQKQFVYGTIVHIDIKGDKVWIQRNNTEINLADRLVEQGIPKHKIVLGFYSPFLRQASGYAVD